MDYSSIKPLKSETFPRYVQDSLPLEPTYELRSPHEATKQEEPKPTQSFESFLKENQFAKEEPREIPSEKKPQAEYQGNDYYNTIFDNEGLSYKLPEMHPIGQVLQTYILCDGIDCFYILDQHAAAERVNYEKTQALFASIRSRIVPLFPITVELSPKEKNNYDEEHINRLNSIGIITEEFGGNTIKVMEIPSFLSEKNDEEVILDCVHSCLNDESSDPLSLLHLTIANIACKKSIKANHKMSLLEIEALLKDLAKCKNPANCPHGRPTIIKISRADIERMFRRTGF
jgi:DNA mismatch repair protein MutL